MVKITGVEAHSLAEKAGVRAGDILLAIDGHDIEDVLDYRFRMTAPDITLALRREGEALTLQVRKETYDDLGLLFETPLMDRKQSCRNKCIFCFIDQLPAGLRETLYFKDDDARLSFLHGNYITLTNLRDRDIDRIIEMHISPVNVSIHTTNPALRCEMMHNRRAGEVLSYLDRLAAAGIRICGQIVLCRGINDGVELDRTMADLEKLMPALTSVSVVPAGLTRHREGLFPLSPFTPEECAAVIARVNAVGNRLLKETGNRLFLLADEFYLKAGLPLPSEAYYGDYEQIENGVGLIRSLVADVERELDFLEEYLPASLTPRRVTIATGRAAAPTLRLICDRITERVPTLLVQVVTIENNFFGPEITVAGLLTGKDMAEQLGGMDLGDCLLIPAVTLRAEGDLFLCGMSPAELSLRLHVPVIPVTNDAADLLSAILTPLESEV